MKTLNTVAISSKMEKLGMNQAFIAEKLSVSRETVSNWLKNETMPRPPALLALSKLLKLSFDEIVSTDKTSIGSFAYRTNRNTKVTSEKVTIADEMMHALTMMSSFFHFSSAFSVPPLTNPVLDYSYIQQIVTSIRSSMSASNETRITEKQIFNYYKQFATVFVPVLWGKNGDDGLHISLTECPIHFIYLNLQKNNADFKFWILHELAHILTPSIASDIKEKFADEFAGAFLYPDSVAKEFYRTLFEYKDTGIVINKIIAEASSWNISPITVFRQLQAYAVQNGLPQLTFNIYPACQNYIKTVKLVSDILFNEESPSVDKYIDQTKICYKTQIWDALTKYLKESHKSASFVQKLLNISYSDAKGVYDYLINGKDSA
jgi:transcriptional regulator with XRE-family HTH domain